MVGDAVIVPPAPHATSTPSARRASSVGTCAAPRGRTSGAHGKGQAKSTRAQTDSSPETPKCPSGGHPGGFRGAGGG